MKGIFYKILKKLGCSDERVNFSSRFFMRPWNQKEFLGRKGLKNRRANSSIARTNRSNLLSAFPTFSIIKHRLADFKTVVQRTMHDTGGYVFT